MEFLNKLKQEVPNLQNYLTEIPFTKIIIMVSVFLLGYLVWKIIKRMLNSNKMNYDKELCYNDIPIYCERVGNKTIQVTFDVSKFENITYFPNTFDYAENKFDLVINENSHKIAKLVEEIQDTVYILPVYLNEKIRTNRVLSFDKIELHNTFSQYEVKNIQRTKLTTYQQHR